MPTFIFNKLIRNKLKDEYTKMGQIAAYKKLTRYELLNELKNKIIEEAREIPVGGTKEAITAELADIQEVIDTIAQLSSITSQEITDCKQKKYEKKGGFSDGLYVETLGLQDDDEWVEYYRTSPDKYKEIGVKETPATFVVPLIEAGIYQHYKGKRYEVIGVGLDSETMKPVVVYMPLDETTVPFWVRPYEMFLEFVTVDGKTVNRFKKIS